MASNEMGAFVEAALDTLVLTTNAQIKSFRIPGARRSGFNLYTAVQAIQTARHKQWVSRKRVRHDALVLLHEGAL